MFNKFNLDSEEYTQKKSKSKLDKIQLSNSTIIMIIIVISFLLVGLVAYGIVKLNTNNYRSLKEDSSKDIVYTIYSNSKYSQEVPYINLKGDIYKEINNNIQEIAGEYLDKETGTITYDFNLNGNFVSLVLVIKEYTGDVPRNNFYTYNIDTTNKQLLSKEALIDYYKTNNDEIKNRVLYELEKAYKEKIDSGDITEELCDFDCYISWRGSQNLDPENYSYYIKDGYLAAYVPFEQYEAFGDDESFDEINDFLILLKEAPTE